MLPNRLIVRKYLMRSIGHWLAVRSACGLIIAFAGSDPLGLAADILLVVLALCIAVGFIELSRRREHVLLGNLGISTVTVGLVFAGPAVFGEVILRLFGSAL